MDRQGDWMQTYTGRQFWPLDPRPEDFCREDIAHALSLKCRYNGHCLGFYSVAQHSVYVAEECERRWPGRWDLAWWGLLHDLEEAYLPDVPRPIKVNGTGTLKDCALKIMEAAAVRFGLTGTAEPSEVKQADSAVLAAEAAQIMAPPPAPWTLPEPAAPVRIGSFWNPAMACALFTNAWIRLAP
jgi:hypothetical protein